MTGQHFGRVITGRRDTTKDFMRIALQKHNVPMLLFTVRAHIEPEA